MSDEDIRLACPDFATNFLSAEFRTEPATASEVVDMAGAFLSFVTNSEAGDETPTPKVGMN